jgi:hypothetical protein
VIPLVVRTVSDRPRDDAQPQKRRLEDDVDVSPVEEEIGDDAVDGLEFLGYTREHNIAPNVKVTLDPSSRLQG